MEMALKTIEGWISRCESQYVCVSPAHAIMDYRRDPELRCIANSSGLSTPDGMSVVWLLRLKGHRNVERVYGPDLILELCKRSLEHGYRHFFYGGAPGVVEDLASRLRGRFDGIRIAGTYTPPFRPLTAEEDQQIVELINASEANIVWIGLGAPKQELWMADHVGLIEGAVLVGVGAAFDFLSGHKPQAPHWMQRSGLEWLFRLGTEPRRLWRRYAHYPLFVVLASAQLLGLKVNHE